MASVVFETLSGGLPNETPPSLVMQRVSAGRVILSWPAKWGGLVPETANPLLSTNTAWSIIESGIPTSDGTTIRQTNSFGAGARYFQLARP